ncbi:WD40/YVTN/BNR-like repeat-containing protein [Parapedobacter sp. 2B3]|uniref:WD40/YVTN/BNR-like repeat-containing protein n=1 Tax=Parapedobacter sp. 2B3 TaxID=3342381 RepID=UPI0035B5AE00
MVRLIAALLLCATGSQAQDVELTILQKGRSTSIRGVSVVDDSVAWVSGSDGWIGRTADRGETWHWGRTVGYETTDFRDIEAFSSNEAVIISAGSPLVILLTEDGGQTWRETHRDERPEVFFDGMDFWDDRQGIAYGDPIGGVMQLLKTTDGGASWQTISHTANIRLADGEAGFAASGTGIRTLDGGHVFIATGGSRARLLHSADGGDTWAANGCPMAQGSASTGIFSIAFRNDRQGIAVGGDYQRDERTNDAVYLTSDGGTNWVAPGKGTNGYRSSVEYLNANTVVASGTSGVDISFDGGLHWHALSGESFHVVRKAKHGSWILLAGADGRIATLASRL